MKHEEWELLLSGATRKELVEEVVLRNKVIEQLQLDLGLIQASAARLLNQKKEADTEVERLRKELAEAATFIAVHAVEVIASNRKICRSCGTNVAYRDHSKTCLVNSIESALSPAKESE